MNEYQYYEFQAVDRPLGEAARKELRVLSAGARITATRFADDYQWDDFRGNPRGLMERWFDLHLHVTNWGARRLMIRLPQRLVDRSRLDRYLRGMEIVDVLEAGDNLIVDIRDDVGDFEADLEDLEDCTTVLTAIAPLRVELLAGDWRVFHLLWLVAVERGWLRDEVVEPLPGLGKLNGALDTLVGLFGIDRDFVEAAKESPPGSTAAHVTGGVAQRVVAAMPESEKVALLCRLLDDEPHVVGEVCNRLRGAVASVAGKSLTRHRTVADLRVRAATIRDERKSAEAERRAAEQVRREQEAERERNARLDVVRRRSLVTWRDVEREINRRNAAAYDQAVDLLLDLKTLAVEQGTVAAFMERLGDLRERHASKTLFLDRLWELNVS